MHLFESLLRLVTRFRYPVSLPEDVACDLGMRLPNTLTFQDFLKQLSSPHQHPENLRRFMLRGEAEQMFKAALKRESFQSCSLFSYYFNKSWLVITLQFDEQDRLRRVSLQCPASGGEFDLSLLESQSSCLSSRARVSKLSS